MNISEFEKIRIEKIFSQYCQTQGHSHAARLDFRLGLDRVSLFWSYPHPIIPNQNLQKNVALFVKEFPGQAWLLYCSDGSGHWHIYQPPSRSLNIEQLLGIVDSNKNNCFFRPINID